MFRSKQTLSYTLGKVNQFISELKAGVESHKKEVDAIQSEINELRIEKDNLQNEIFQATQLIGTLSGTNS